MDSATKETMPLDAPDMESFLKEFNEKLTTQQTADEKMHFSYDLEATLTQEERDADVKLQEMCKIICDPDTRDRTIENFFVNKKFMENCRLFKALNAMPKGAIHHIHTTAANPILAYLSLTKEPEVFFNGRERLFKVFPKWETDQKDMIPGGYVQCIKMREFHSDPDEFDQYLKDQILLMPHQANDLESHDIWKFFQHKFTKVGELGKYVPFFKKLTKLALKSCIDQNVFIVEYRHISGMLFDDDKKPIPFLEELKIIREIIDDLQKDTPHFDFRLILTGLKIVGEPHIKKMIHHIQEGSTQEDSRLAELIAGFDMVNEEDFTPEISSFAKEILTAKKTIMVTDTNPDGMPCFFHAGETHDRGIKNLQDAIEFGSKRIGHGFQLQLFPLLQDYVKKRDICVEVCPLSNMVLGYTKDLRTHPMRSMLSWGIQASINSDDPGLFGYEGVTLDYVYAFGAWELNIRDLKKFSLNGIKYASITEEHKEKLYKVMEPMWNDWIKSVNEGKF